MPEIIPSLIHPQILSNKWSVREACQSTCQPLGSRLPCGTHSFGNWRSNVKNLLHQPRMFFGAICLSGGLRGELLSRFYFFIFMKLCAQAKEQPIKLKISQEHCQNNKQTRTRDRNQVETVYSGHRGDRDPVFWGVLLVAKLQGADAEMRQSWMWQNGWEDLS